jgi:hypothetical protein
MISLRTFGKESYMEFRHLAIGLVLCASAMSAQAASVAWTSTVRSVYPQGDGSFIITFASDSGSGCTSASNPKYFTVAVLPANGSTVNSDAVKAMLATTLAAFEGGNTLTVVFDNSTSSCNVTRMTIS